MPRPRKTKETDSLFHITLKMGEDVYESAGKDALEALRNMKRPQKICVKGVLTLRFEDKTTEYPLPPIRIKRLFYPLAQKVVAKQLGLLSL